MPEPSEAPTPSTPFVTSRHGVLRDAIPDKGWQPYGPHHARRPGDATTACGLSADGWIMFWEMRFNTEDARSCARCVLASMSIARNASESPRQRLSTSNATSIPATLPRSSATRPYPRHSSLWGHPRSWP